jgi:hypothetical protein
MRRWNSIAGGCGLSEETVGWIDAPGDPIPAPKLAGDVEPSGNETPRPTRAVGKISVALVVAWTTLVAVPGAMPWVATDDSTRTIAFGIVIASVVALIGLVLAWVRVDELGNAAATLGMAASLAALGLAALEVINVMVLPQDAPYRRMATGIGLLLLIAVALAAVAAVRTSVFEGVRLSWLSFTGAAIGIVLVAVYLLMVQTMVVGAAVAEDAEWARLTTLLAGLQTLVFAGLGALLGTVVQAQVTSSTRNELRRADEALRLVDSEAREMVDELRHQAARGGDETEEVLLEALRLDPSRLRTETAQRRWIRANRPPSMDTLAGLADSLDQVVVSARRVRAGSATE